MLQNIVDSCYETSVWYEVEFLVDRNGGLGFPCDADGNVNLKNMTDAAKENYKWAMEHPEKFPYSFNEVRRHESKWRNPAHGKCECGNEVYLVNQYMGACQCDECGRWYNMSGQPLNPPEYWYENDDDFDESVEEWW